VIVNVEELCEVLVFIDTRLHANSEDTKYAELRTDTVILFLNNVLFGDQL